MTFTLKQVNDAISAWEETYDGDSFYDEVEYEDEGIELTIDGQKVVAKKEDSYGGEGQGDEYWVVFRINDQLFRVDGYWQSWEGGEYDGDLYEVEPYQVMVTRYRAKK
jgi:hypothetical protein